jgi:hypothetical protein
MSNSKNSDKLLKLEAFERKISRTEIIKKPVISKRKLVNNKFIVKKNIQKSPKKLEKLLKPKKIEKSDKINKSEKPKKQRRQLIYSVCTGKKMCGEHYGQYIWERLCNEHNIEITKEEFEKNGITFKKSICQGMCKKASNIKVVEPLKEKSTQFSYMTPLKAVKLAKSLNSGAKPENIKKL